MNVLMIDDDVGLGQTMQPVLQMFAIDLDVVHSAEEGLVQIQAQQYDLVLLDVMLPRITGLELCRTIRHLPAPVCDIPIIMLSARSELVDRVVGLETGADDYVAKPFEPRELIARINAVCRRFQDAKKGNQTDVVTKSLDAILFQLNDDTLRIDVAAAQVWVNEQLLAITAMEFDLLFALSQAPNQVLSQDDLLQQCSGHHNLIYSRSIVALIYRLRNKIRDAGANADFIRTIRNRGYSMVGYAGKTAI
ncbi:response regulator transcription factor [Orbaceae bacterium ESL0727]|nr:response regulator transcription factor [Orbaceae bacterium ESL0727]